MVSSLVAAIISLFVHLSLALVTRVTRKHRFLPHLRLFGGCVDPTFAWTAVELDAGLSVKYGIYVNV